jgi:hypothetical protein
MDTPVVENKKFKMTFQNSFWQCCIALLCFKPIQLVIAVILAVFVTSFLGYSAELNKNLISLSNVFALGFVSWLAWYLAKRSWLRRQNKAATTATT